MKASAGGYARASDVRQALEMLAASDGSGRVLAGGQSLIAAMNMRLSTGDILIDISRIGELAGVRETSDSLWIGALTPHAEIGRNALIRDHAPLLSQAVTFIAHAAIRNRGTIGGALAHADPAAEFPACVLALGATLHVEGLNGRRDIPAEDFFHDLFETAIQDGEILTGLSIPKAGPDERQTITEVARRSGDYALAGVCLVQRSGKHRLSLFSVAPKPVLAVQAMAELDRGDIEGAVRALQADIDPSSDTQATATYRRHLAGTLLRRAAASIRGESE